MRASHAVEGVGSSPRGDGSGHVLRAMRCISVRELIPWGVRCDVALIVVVVAAAAVVVMGAVASAAEALSHICAHKVCVDCGSKCGSTRTRVA